MSALTADDEYSDASLLSLYRQALARGAVMGSTLDLGHGRTMVCPGPKELRETIDWLEKKIASDAPASASADADGGTTSLGSFNFIPTTYARS